MIEVGEDTLCAHRVPLVSKIGGPSNYCAECHEAGVPFLLADPENWSFDVTTALHDDMKGGGGYRTVRSRVTVSREAFPKWTTAAEVAGCMAACHHGGMPIEILPRY